MNKNIDIGQNLDNKKLKSYRLHTIMNYIDMFFFKFDDECTVYRFIEMKLIGFD